MITTSSISEWSLKEFKNHKILQVGCGAARWPGGDYGYTTVVVCQYAEAGNIIGGRGQAFDIGTPCSACKEDCDPDYFGGVLCNPLVQTSSQPSSRDPTEPTIITTTEIPVIEDVGFNDVTSDLNSCESDQVKLSQNGIVDIHNGYRADVSWHKIFFSRIIKAILPIL